MELLIVFAPFVAAMVGAFWGFSIGIKRELEWGDRMYRMGYRHAADDIKLDIDMRAYRNGCEADGQPDEAQEWRDYDPDC